MQRSYAVPAGSHTFRWTYAKDDSGSAGLDSAWLDQVVFSPTGSIPLADALDNPPDLTFTTNGNANWQGQATVTKDGIDAAKSGAITDDQLTWMETTVNLANPATLSFWWAVSSEGDYDYLRFYIDTVEQAAISGTLNGLGVDPLPWEQKMYQLPAGTHTLRWEYSKDGSVSEGADAGWVDMVALCEGSYTVAPGVLTTGFAGGTAAFTITPVSGSCPWSINAPSWMTPDIASGSAEATVTVTIAAGPELMGNINVAGQTVLVKRIGSGGLDSTFTPNPGVYSASPTGYTTFDGGVARQSDGKLLAVGSASAAAAPGSGQDITLLRFNANGSLDTTFASGGTAVWDNGAANDEYGVAIAVQADDKIVVLGGITPTPANHKMILIRYDKDGNLDTTFGDGTGSITFTPDSSYFFEATALTIQADGKLVVSGSSWTTPNNAIVARFNADGTLDSGADGFGSGTGYVVFNPGTTNASAASILYQAGGSLLFGGEIAGTGQSSGYVARLLSDGSLDTTFNGTGYVTTASAAGKYYSLKPIGFQSLGTIIVTSDLWDSVASISTPFMMRLTSSGLQDPTFGSGGVATYVPATGEADFTKSVVLADDRIVTVGGYYPVTGNDQALTVLCDANGVLDATFGSGGVTSLSIPGGTGNWLYSILQQPDGKLVSVGTIYGTVDNGFIMRQSSGAADTTPPTDGTLSPPPLATARSNLPGRQPRTMSVLPATNWSPQPAATPADCSGTAIYSGTALTYTDTGLTNGDHQLLPPLRHRCGRQLVYRGNGECDADAGIYYLQLEYSCQRQLERWHQMVLWPCAGDNG